MVVEDVEGELGFLVAGEVEDQEMHCVVSLAGEVVEVQGLHRDAEGELVLC